MNVIVLQSGSNGNCIYVESSDVRLLVDAGISGRRAEHRLADRRRDIRQVDALLISHDHADHIRCAGIYQRKFALPIHITRATLRHGNSRCALGRLDDVRHFAAGQTLRFGHVAVETVPTAHDGADGVAFVIDDGDKRVGILTDLGHVFDSLADVIATLDAVVLESNYDPDMLTRGRYPAFLKRRIKGPGGHISNYEAADLLAAAGKKMKWACLGHLSAENNSPDLVMAVHNAAADGRFSLHVASRYEATQVLGV